MIAAASSARECIQGNRESQPNHALVRFPEAAPAQNCRDPAVWRGASGSAGLLACSGAVGLETGCAVRVQRRGYCALFRVGVHTLRDWTCVREGHRLSPPDDRQGEFLPDLFMYVDRRLVLRSCIVLCVKGIVDSENDSRMLID